MGKQITNHCNLCVGTSSLCNINQIFFFLLCKTNVIVLTNKKHMKYRQQESEHCFLEVQWLQSSIEANRGEWREKSHTLSLSPQTPTCSGACQCGGEVLSEKWILFYITNTCLPSGNTEPEMVYGPLELLNIMALKQLLLIVSDNVPRATLDFL